MIGQPLTVDQGKTEMLFYELTEMLKEETKLEMELDLYYQKTKTVKESKDRPQRQEWLR